MLNITHREIIFLLRQMEYAVKIKAKRLCPNHHSSVKTSFGRMVMFAVLCDI